MDNEMARKMSSISYPQVPSYAISSLKNLNISQERQQNAQKNKNKNL